MRQVAAGLADAYCAHAILLLDSMGLNLVLFRVNGKPVLAAK
jgi:hypothetical protein